MELEVSFRKHHVNVAIYKPSFLCGKDLISQHGLDFLRHSTGKHII